MITPSQIVPERVLSARFDPCYYLLYGGKVVAVVYWEDDDDLLEGAPAQFFYFLADSTHHHDSLQITDTPPSLDVALAEARRRVADVLRERPTDEIVGLEDLASEDLPWRLLKPGEDPL